MKTLINGLLLTALIAACAGYISTLPWMVAHGMSVLVIAIVIGLVIGNTVYPRWQSHCAAGVGFSKQKLLRLGIILYGFRLTFQDIGHIGWAAVVIDILMVFSTFFIAYFIGVKWWRMDKTSTILIGAGSAICGVAAVMSTNAVVKSKPEQVSIAVATVVIFGTSTMLIYPELYHWFIHSMPTVTQEQYGIYIGSTVHEVAQVVAVGRMISDTTGDYAVVTKMVRVMLLVPFLLLLSFFWQRQRTDNQQKQTITIPWFAFGFIAVTVLHSWITLPLMLVQLMQQISTAALAMAMAALGLTTHISVIKQAGFTPLLLGALLFVWLVVGGWGVNYLVLHAFL